MLERIVIVIAMMCLSGVALFAFWPQQPEDPRKGWCTQYPAACAYENPDTWAQFVEDRRNGVR